MRGFYTQIIVEVPEGATPVEKATIESISSFEERNGFLLPNSYKEFIRQFGPGMIGNTIRVTAPGYSMIFDWDLEAFHNDVDIDNLRERVPGSASGSFDFFFFGSTYGGDQIAWHTDGITKGEYPIVAFPREDRIVVELAKDFDELLAPLIPENLS